MSQYVNELQHFWADLDQCDPVDLPHAESMEIARNWVERRRVMQFLKGLDQGFESSTMCCFINDAFVLDEAIVAMSQEEVHSSREEEMEMNLLIEWLT